MKRQRRLVWIVLAPLLSLLAAFYVGLRQSEVGTTSVQRSQAEQGATTSASAADRRPIRIGWTAWADAEWITRLVTRLLEERLDQPVELVMADIGLQYQGLLNGDLDLMLMAWLPVTHADYYERVAGRVLDLGPVYTGARLGWVVPAYVPRDELGSIADLRSAENRARLGGRIVGIDPGSGLMRASRRAVRVYELNDWSLVSSSAAGMAAELDRAIREHEWVVATAWYPHWIFARYELRYLDDPLGMLGRREQVHALAREGFGTDFPPRVLDFLTRLYVPIDEVEKALLVANERSMDEAVQAFIESETARIDYWVEGTP